MNLFPTITRAKSGTGGITCLSPTADHYAITHLAVNVIVNNISIIITGVLPEVVQAWFFLRKFTKR